MFFAHSSDIWRRHPKLVPGVLSAGGITSEATVDRPVAGFVAIAESRLAAESVGQLPEIQAWRQAFSTMGLKPTQYRCAAESLLRRFNKDKELPRIHPLVDLCNAISLAFATPVAVFDSSRISGDLEVRHASGDEEYLTFAGEVEHPAPGEVIFADSAGRAHARRWTNRQSGWSSVGESTSDVLIVAEAMHDSAYSDVQSLMTAIADGLERTWSTTATAVILSQSSPRFEL